VAPETPRHQLEIAFCDRCGDRDQALDAAREVLEQWAAELEAVTLRPMPDDRFDVSLDGEVLFAGRTDARHPEPGQLNTLLEARLGPAPGFGA
jgi:predicted Rdx family selenoprotein